MPSCSDTSRLRLTILKGKTFSHVLRWGTARIIYRAITGISRAGPAVVTAPAHGLVNGWPFRIFNVGGMTQINSDERAMAPDGGWYPATVLTPDTVEINPLNSAGFSAYTSGGQIQYNEPVDLAAYSGARMQVRSDVDSPDILLELSTTNGGIVLDNAAKTITLRIDAVASAALAWESGVTDIEMLATAGQVSLLASADVLATSEVTR